VIFLGLAFNYVLRIIDCRLIKVMCPVPRSYIAFPRGSSKIKKNTRGRKRYLYNLECKDGAYSKRALNVLIIKLAAYQRVDAGDAKDRLVSV